MKFTEPPIPRTLGRHLYEGPPLRHGYCTYCSSHTVAKKWFGPLICINKECVERHGEKQPNKD